MSILGELVILHLEVRKFFCHNDDYRRHLSIEPKQTFQTGLISIIYVESFG